MASFSEAASLTSAPSSGSSAGSSSPSITTDSISISPTSLSSKIMEYQEVVPPSLTKSENLILAAPIYR